MPIEMTGDIVRGEEGRLLFVSCDKTYIIISDKLQELIGLVGKTLVASGNVSINAYRPSFEILSYSVP